jgi:hypothetical protein
MRFVIGVVLALSVGIGAYLGSAQAAGSAKTPPRTVNSRAAESVTVFGNNVDVEKKIGHVQCFWQSPRPAKPHPPGPSTTHWHRPYFSENLRCDKGRTYVNGSIEVLPHGIAFFKRRTMVYRTGWGKR